MYAVLTYIHIYIHISAHCLPAFKWHCECAIGVRVVPLTTTDNRYSHTHSHETHSCCTYFTLTQTHTFTSVPTFFLAFRTLSHFYTLRTASICFVYERMCGSYYCTLRCCCSIPIKMIENKKMMIYYVCVCLFFYIG